MVLEAGDEVALADLEHVVVGLGAFEGLVVDRADEVDLHEVALGARAGPSTGLRLAKRSCSMRELGVDLAVGDLGARPFRPRARCTAPSTGSGRTCTLAVKANGSLPVKSPKSISGIDTGSSSALSTALSYHSGRKSLRVWLRT